MGLEQSEPAVNNSADLTPDSASAQNIQIQCADGVQIQGVLCPCKGKAAGALLVAGALGVPQRFYRHFAAFMAAQGWHTLTFDYRGCGASKVGAQVYNEADFRTWGEQDVDAALGELMRRFSDIPVTYLGHSMGGQLVGFTPHCQKLSACVMFGSSLPHWRRWPLRSGIGLWLLWNVLVPLLTVGRKTFPARRLGLSSENVPAAGVRQWARWSRDPDYLFAHRFGIDTVRFSQMHCPMLFLRMVDDHYASERAVAALMKRFPKANGEMESLDPKTFPKQPVGHFNFFRPGTGDPGWEKISGWLGQWQS